MPELKLTQRRTHILAAALDGLAPRAQQLLGWISVLTGLVRWETLAAINPFRPEPPVSEPATRAQAQLDAALKDLEDRGLLWWDRSSNTYDLHPIIRAFAHDQLGEIDRVRANDRIRDHFQALPPEDPDHATSVEDLSQTITIFRALVGANHLDDASRLCMQFDKALLVDIGAYSTIIELLGPLATAGSARVRGDLAIAYAALNRLDEAIKQDVSILADKVRHEDVEQICVSLSRLEEHFRRSGRLIAANRCISLRGAIAVAQRIKPDGDFILSRAVQAISRGEIERGRQMIDLAQSLGPPENSPWFKGLRIPSKFGDCTLGLSQMVRSSRIRSPTGGTANSSWEFLRDIAGIRCQLYMLEKQFDKALAASEEHDQLDLNAGLDIAPARTAGGEYHGPFGLMDLEFQLPM